MTQVVESREVRDGVAPAASRDLVILAVMLVTSLFIRLLLLPIPGSKDDIECFTSWANIFRVLPVDQFYSHDSPESDYLPGYLYILAATAGIREMLVATPADPARFAIWIKVAPIAADLVLGIALFVLCRRFLGPRPALLAAALALFNPGLIFVGSVWGQVDSIGAALAVSSFTALLLGSPILAAILAGAAFITKPQYAAFLMVAGAAYLRAGMLRLPPWDSAEGRSAWRQWAIWGIAAPVVALVATVELLLVPFSVSIWPMGEVEWTLFQRLGIATTKFPFATITAFNLWATPIAGMRSPDSVVGWLSLTLQAWGWLLLAVALVLCALAAWRRPNHLPTVILACGLAAIAFFVLLTRIHERYLFVAIPLLAAGVVFNRRTVSLYVAASILFLLNVWASYSGLLTGKVQLAPGVLSSLVLAASGIAILMLIAGLVGLLAMAFRKEPPAGYSEELASPWGIQVPVSVSRVPRTAIVAVLVIVAVGGGFLVGRGTGATDQGVHGVMVRAYRPWQDSGVRVVEGQRLFISARGDWTNKRGGERFGPGGGRRLDEGTVMPQVPIGVLLARIGDSEPFVVGEGISLTAGTAGALRFVMNDWLDDRDDAQGSARVKITVTEP